MQNKSMCHVHVPVCAMHVCFCAYTDLKKDGKANATICHGQCKTITLNVIFCGPKMIVIVHPSLALGKATCASTC